MDIIRTQRHGCFRLATNAWGTYLVPTSDPEANSDIDAEAIKTMQQSFELNEPCRKITIEPLNKWLRLCYDLALQGNSDEVTARFLVSEEDSTIWRIIIPPQRVDGASATADTFDGSIDIDTGEVIEHYPPAGWIPAGSTHSHNKMSLDRFSATDDASELRDPGLHVLISHIREQVPGGNGCLKITASITAGGRRYYIPADKVVELERTSIATEYHPDVLKLIDNTPRLGLYGWPYGMSEGGHQQGWPQARTQAPRLGSRLWSSSNAQDDDEDSIWCNGDPNLPWSTDIRFYEDIDSLIERFIFLMRTFMTAQRLKQSFEMDMQVAAGFDLDLLKTEFPDLQQMLDSIPATQQPAIKV